jgi:1D-myo-inositol-triphosphate 3-kinase
MVQWTPFVQTFKNRRYQWVQLAGHSGNFKAGKNQGTVLKKLCPQEENCYKQFHDDSLSLYVPEYQGTLLLENDESKNYLFSQEFQIFGKIH